MFHLDAGVDLDEVEILVLVHQEFNRSQTAVIESHADFAGGLIQPLARMPDPILARVILRSVSGAGAEWSIPVRRG